MTLLRALLISVAIAAVFTTSEIAAQTPRDLLEQGVRAYGDLEYDAAAAFLQRALRATPGIDIQHEEFGRALIFLAATELYRGNPDLAEERFRQLVIFDTRIRPDELVFPPEVTNIFDAVRRGTKAVTPVVPTRSELEMGVDSFSIVLHASSFTGSVVEILDDAGVSVRLLYDGPVNDSLIVTWDGYDSNGRRPSDGEYELAVTARRPGGRSLRTTTFPVTLEAILRDTIPHPVPLADSLFLPEQAEPSRGYESLLGGVLMGGAIMVLPSVVASDAEISGTRFVVSGSVTLAGIIGFFQRRPGRIFTDNIDANNALRARWQASLDSVLSENVTRNADVRLVIETGPSTQVELEQP